MNKVLERAAFENKEPFYDSGRMIVGEGHLALKDDIKFNTRRHLTPYGLEEVELQHDGRKLDTTGTLCISLTEYKAMDPAPPFTSVSRYSRRQEEPSGGEQIQRCSRERPT